MFKSLLNIATFFTPTYYKPYMLGRFHGKIVLTVHNMIHEFYSMDDGAIVGKLFADMIQYERLSIFTGGNIKKK